MDIKTKAVKDITPIFLGGAETINTPSSSPDAGELPLLVIQLNKKIF